MESPEEIHVLNKRVRLLQPADGFRTSLDSVMLAAACPAREGGSVLDLGCGVGGAGFCVLARVEKTTLTGIDIQADHIELAIKNAVLNNMKERCNFIHADIQEYEGGRFDHLICNPPYHDAAKHTPSPSPAKAAAHSQDIEVKEWIDAAFRNLKSGGSFTIIHRADQSDKIIQALGRRFGAVETIPLWPRTGQNAKRVIIRAAKDRRSPSSLHAGIVLHEKDGSYTAAADQILRDMKAIV